MKCEYNPADTFKPMKFITFVQKSWILKFLFLLIVSPLYFIYKILGMFIPDIHIMLIMLHVDHDGENKQYAKGAEKSLNGIDYLYKHRNRISGFEIHLVSIVDKAGYCLEKLEDHGKILDLEKRAGNDLLSVEKGQAMIDLGLSHALNRFGFHLFHSDIDKSIVYFSRGIEVDENNTWAYLYRGWALFKKKDYTKALQDYSRCLPKEREGYFFRGVCLKKMEQYDDAIKDFTKSIEIDVKVESSYYERGLCYLGQDQLQPAVNELEKAKSFFVPDDDMFHEIEKLIAKIKTEL